MALPKSRAGGRFRPSVIDHNNVAKKLSGGAQWIACGPSVEILKVLDQIWFHWVIAFLSRGQ
jgi:hypothetical protein